MKNPLKISWKTEIVPLILVVLTVLLSIVSYPDLPLKVISHWNFAGVADGYSSRNFHALFFPALILFIYIMMLVMPYLDPKKENYAKFAKVYHIFKALLVAVLFVVFSVATLVNLGWSINVGPVIAGTIGVMMIIMGYYLRDIHENWFIGIRTPWTMSSPVVWEKTHKLGSWLFMFFGLVLIVMPYLPQALAVILLVISVLALILGTVLYSYLIYREEKKVVKKKKQGK